MPESVNLDVYDAYNMSNLYAYIPLSMYQLTYIDVLKFLTFISRYGLWAFKRGLKRVRELLWIWPVIKD